MRDFLANPIAYLKQGANVGGKVMLGFQVYQVFSALALDGKHLKHNVERIRSGQVSPGMVQELLSMLASTERCACNLACLVALLQSLRSTEDRPGRSS